LDNAGTGPVLFGRPETAAGGFAADDETVAFFLRVNALLSPTQTVVDLGAGRGSRFQGGEKDFKVKLAKLQGKCGKVIGIDVDEGIHDHPYLDERHVVAPNGPWPIATGSVDLIVSEWVLEHVADPASFASEVDRVLKPEGWFCALTPNSRGYVGVLNRLVPTRLKPWLMRRVWPERNEQDVFPTTYRLNNRRALEAAFPKDAWFNHSYYFNPTPRYHGNRPALFGLVGIYQWLMPKSFRTDLMVFVQKRH